MAEQSRHTATPDEPRRAQRGTPYESRRTPSLPCRTRGTWSVEAPTQSIKCSGSEDVERRPPQLPLYAPFPPIPLLRVGSLCVLVCVCVCVCVCVSVYLYITYLCECFACAMSGTGRCGRRGSVEEEGVDETCELSRRGWDFESANSDGPLELENWPVSQPRPPAVFSAHRTRLASAQQFFVAFRPRGWLKAILRALSFRAQAGFLPSRDFHFPRGFDQIHENKFDTVSPEGFENLSALGSVSWKTGQFLSALFQLR